MADADVVSLQISLPQMLDLALGTPEVGAVNFNILHNFLHILLYQTNLGSIQVEYRGDGANRLKNVVTSQKSSPTLYLQEYNITDASGNSAQRNVDEKGPSAHVFTNDPNAQATAGIKQAVGSGEEGELQKVIFVEPIVDGTTPTGLAFKKLEQSVNELQHRFQALEELPTNPELVERLKGKITDPISDVWQVINITKRLDASETGIDKLTSMIQDVIKGGQITPIEGAAAPSSDTEARLTNLEHNVSEIGETLKNLQVIANISEEDEGRASSQTQESAEQKTAISSPEVNATNEGHQEERAQSHQKTSPAKRLSLNQLLGGVNIQEMNGDVNALKSEVSQLREDLEDVRDKVTNIPSADEKGRITSREQSVKKERGSEHVSRGEPPQQAVEADYSEQTVKSERVSKPSSTHESVSKGGGSRSPKQKREAEVPDFDIEVIQKLDERVKSLEQEVASLADKANNASSVAEKNGNDVNELIAKIQGMESYMEKVNEMADRLVDDRENREVNMNALLEQVELLKTIKADKEDLEDALADKADAHAIHRKVSHDQFDAACDGLARGLEDAINKLGKQEMIWQQALDEVQREIEGKLDKIEIAPLRDFVSSRLKALQDKLRNVAEMRDDNEAAGTKKLLRDVQCISCDKNVVMRTEETGKYRADTLPCNVSLKPYLTYELDQVRKQQKRLPHSRNMIQFEAALQEESRRQRTQKPDTLVKTPRDHLCNRYCGGSHTVITPHQRVMRTGHFLDQWGPDIVQLTEGVVKGSDGKMYRGRPVKFDVCGPTCETSEEKVRSTERMPSTSSRQRKSSFEERHSTSELRRRTSGSRKPSGELSAVHVKEMMMDDERIRPLEQMEEEAAEDIAADQVIEEEDVLPIDPLDPPDEVIQYEDDETDIDNDA